MGQMFDPAHLCIVRHGETDWNAQGILQGWLDIPLNDLGRQQALDLASDFAGHGISEVWTSPLVRATETAEIVAAALGLPPPRIHEGLRERCFGAIQGIPKTELAESNPLILQQILRRNPAADFEGGETMDEFADRVLNALSEIGRRHHGKKLLVITHGWAMDVVTRHVRGLPVSTMLNLKRRNGESLWLRVAGSEIVVESEPDAPAAVLAPTDPG